MAAHPSFAELLDGLEATHREQGLVIVTASRKASFTLFGDADMVIPFLVEQGREALRRAAEGEALEPADAGLAQRRLAEASR